MKTPVLIIALLLTFTATSAAQTPAPYQVDNFDFAGAVKIEQPVSTSAGRKSGRTRKLTSTSKLIYSPPDLPLTQLTSLNLTGSLDGFTTGDTTVDGFIVESGRRNAVDPLLLYSIMHQESTFKRQAISPKGARGLMQLMPGTAARYGVTNPYDIAQNISGGTRYLKDLLKMFNGRVDLALAGYNAGENAVIKYGYTIPPYDETRNYVKLIIKRYGKVTTAEQKSKS